MRSTVYFKITLISLLVLILVSSCQKDEIVNTAPTCSLTSPVNDTTIVKGKALSICANASDIDGNIKVVNFFIDNSKIGESTSAPYNFTWNTSSVSIGTHLLRVEAFDNNNAKALKLIKIKVNVDSSLYPHVKTISANSITSSSAICGGNVLTDGGFNIVKRGIWYGYIPKGDSVYKTNTVYDGTNGTGSFNCALTNLLPNTEYHFMAFARNSVDSVGWGNETVFTTSPDKAVIITTTISNIASTTATGGGNIVADGGAPVSERGICWSTGLTPTIADSHTNDGTGTGIFSSSLQGLTPNTKYYVRAFAINSYGVSYGEAVSFTTSIDYSNYYNVSSSQKSIVFSDDFIDNTNSWPTSYTSSNGYPVTMTITGGNYFLNYNESGFYQKTSLTLNNFDPTGNFEITARLLQTKTYNSGNSFVGVIWGSSSKVRHFELYQDIGKYYAGQSTDSWTNWSGITFSSSVLSSASSYNILTVRKINNVYYFFVNAKFVYSYSSDSLTSSDNKVGFDFDQCGAYVDYLYIYKLNL